MTLKDALAAIALALVLLAAGAHEVKRIRAAGVCESRGGVLVRSAGGWSFLCVKSLEEAQR